MFSISINRVAVPVGLGGLSEARQFYGGVLGLKEVEVPEALGGKGGAWFELAGGQKLQRNTRQLGDRPFERFGKGNSPPSIGYGSPK